MGVNTTTLNCIIKQNVFIDQPPRFENHDNHNHAYKLKQALYIDASPKACKKKSSFI